MIIIIIKKQDTTLRAHVYSNTHLVKIENLWNVTILSILSKLFRLRPGQYSRFYFGIGLIFNPLEST